MYAIDDELALAAAYELLGKPNLAQVHLNRALYYEVAGRVARRKESW